MAAMGDKSDKPQMDEYQEPLQRVDDALERLRATLASYTLKGSLSPAPSPKLGDRAWSKVPVSGTTGRRRRSIAGSGQADVQTWRTDNDGKASTRHNIKVNSTKLYNNISNMELRKALRALNGVQTFLEHDSYSIALHIKLARSYIELGYPDLAVGAAYKALLLSDAIQDPSDELHIHSNIGLLRSVENEPIRSRIGMLKRDRQAVETLLQQFECNVKNVSASPNEAKQWLFKFYTLATYLILAQCLYICGCFRSAYRYCQLGLKLYPGHGELSNTADWTTKKVAAHFGIDADQLFQSQHKDPQSWPDRGLVRRERYPWNHHEPHRLSELDYINEQMRAVAPKLEVHAVELPLLKEGGEVKTMYQLGVFAKEDIQPGERILVETSLLTANNKLQDALCDACSEDLPPLTSPKARNVVQCSDCDVIFCSERCHQLAMDSYHPALCNMDVDAIAKDVPPAEAADSLYLLLLLRTLAMAQTQQCHPLDLHEVKYTWADYHTVSLDDEWKPLTATSVPHDFPKDLPFSFEHNVVLPYHMLEKMDIDFFAKPQYDVWVFNTLFAKFRGTASARVSGLGGRAIRGPEVSAVHPLWCLANHSCDPNVQWEWGGSINYRAREERVAWRRADGDTKRSQPGIRKGEEVLNHYCDVDLAVKERREWARGSLGGECRCARCVWEAKQETEGSASS